MTQSLSGRASARHGESMPLPSNPPTVRDIVEYARGLKHPPRDLAPSGYNLYRTQLRQFLLVFPDLHAAELDVGRLRDYLEKRERTGIKRVSAAQDLTALRWAVRLWNRNHAFRSVPEPPALPRLTIKALVEPPPAEAPPLTVADVMNAFHEGSRGRMAEPSWRAQASVIRKISEALGQLPAAGISDDAIIEYVEKRAAKGIDPICSAADLSHLRRALREAAARGEKVRELPLFRPGNPLGRRFRDLHEEHGRQVRAEEFAETLATEAAPEAPAALALVPVVEPVALQVVAPPASSPDAAMEQLVNTVMEEKKFLQEQLRVKDLRLMTKDEQIEELQSALDRTKARLDEAESCLAQRNTSLAAQPPQPATVEPAPAADVEVFTLSQAVHRAKIDFRKYITFGADVDVGIRTVEPSAGPPAKVYRYLTLLAQVVNERRRGISNGNFLMTLQNKGVECTGEGEQIRNSPNEQRKRTWSTPRGPRAFNLHMKPSNGTSNGRLVRIYFDWSEEDQRAIIGWIGQHPS